MPLQPGTHVGPYQVIAPLGVGGMGEVYRARDAKLNRDVAIKILPQLFTEDPDRLIRFRREAQVLAALNHPNIGQIYGFEDSGDTHALVLELVEGVTLAERIALGPVPLDEALPIARQIADALECAHEQGIIHRDLKPANIKIRPDGSVKVLDFGLAKALEGPAESGAHASAMNSPTLTARGTQVGVIVGTAAYMAPEQARGRATDRRADIWAFGVVLYEMLTGRRAFEGDDVSITLASVLKDDLKWTELPPDLPPSIRRLLRRSLEKEPRRRLSAIGDARLELEDLNEITVVAPAAPTPAGWRQAMPWAFALLASAALLGTLALWAPWRRPPVNPPVRVVADIGVESPLAVNMSSGALISPDGQAAVLVVKTADRNMLYIRKLDQLQSTSLADTEDAQSPFFSPDSRWIGFFAAGRLKKVAVTGGAVVTLCDAPNGRGGSWGTDGTIVFQPNTVAGGLLHRVSDAGGTAVAIGISAPRDVARRWPQILPGGKALLYSSNTATIGWNTGNLMVQPLPDGAPKELVRGAFHGRYASSGHLLYIRDGTLFSVLFDAQRLEVRGDPRPVVEGVRAAINTGGAQFSISDTGTLLYVPGTSAGNDLPVTWLDQAGKTSLLRAEPADWGNPAFSPDGTWLAMSIGSGPMADIWIYQWARDILRQVTFGGGVDTAPVWTRDGIRIAYASAGPQNQTTNLYWKRTDGTGEVQRLTDSPNAQTPTSFHPSGKFLAYEERRPDTGADIMILPLMGSEREGWKPGSPVAFANSAALEIMPAFSPDGRWLAYSSSESGPGEVYVRPFPMGESKWKVSVHPGGLFPVWSRARSEIFYAAPLSGQVALMVAEYETQGDSLRVGKPRQWFPNSITVPRPGHVFDLHPDGNRIAIAYPPDDVQQHRPVFVFNFFDELRRKSR